MMCLIVGWCTNKPRWGHLLGQTAHLFHVSIPPIVSQRWCQVQTYRKIRCEVKLEVLALGCALMLVLRRFRMGGLEILKKILQFESGV